MEWEKKVEMIKHFNNNEDEKGVDIVLNNIDLMDEQGWDMFFTAITLTIENISRCKEKHKLIYEKTKDMQSESFRTAMRMALYEQLVTDGSDSHNFLIQ